MMRTGHLKLCRRFGRNVFGSSSEISSLVLQNHQTLLRTLTTATTTTIHSNNNEKREDHVNAHKKLDAFRIFSLPYVFQIDEDSLRSRYREMMKNLHPDMMIHQQATTRRGDDNSTDREAHDNNDDASVVTHAYDTLKRPHIRAMHLLELLGYPIDKEETTSTSSNGTSAEPPLPQDSEFLIEIMDLRLEIEDAHTDMELQPLFTANVQRIANTCQSLHSAIEMRDLNEAYRLASKLQYWNRIDETLRDKMESIDQSIR